VAEMVVPEVNKEMLADLEGMGFATVRATRALHFSGMFSDIVGHFRWDLIIIIDCLCWNQNFLALKSMDLSRKKIHPI
jgi:Holliday junction resolvase